MKDTPALALKISKRGVGVYFGGSMSWLCIKLLFYLYHHTRDTSVAYEKAECVHFIYMQHQKIKFKSIQMNMKQVWFTRNIKSYMFLDS